MSRGITIKINRAEAVRIIGAAMRTKTQQFHRDKATWPKRFQRYQKVVVGRLMRSVRDARVASSSQKLIKVAEASEIKWSVRKDIPREPELNLCKEKQLLLMLQNDVREVVPINSNHELWAVLQGKCEPIL